MGLDRAAILEKWTPSHVVLCCVMSTFTRARWPISRRRRLCYCCYVGVGVGVCVSGGLFLLLGGGGDVCQRVAFISGSYDCIVLTSHSHSILPTFSSISPTLPLLSFSLFSRFFLSLTHTSLSLFPTLHPRVASDGEYNNFRWHFLPRETLLK